MNRWYRAYEGTISDPKLAEAALATGARRSVVIAVWHGILESAAAVDDGGRYDTTARRLAAVLGEEPATIEAILDAFGEIGLVADGSVVAWKSRQHQGDSSAERVRRHRLRQLERGDDETSRNGDVTLRNVTAPLHVTRCNGDVTLRNAPETETESEIHGGGDARTRASPARSNPDCAMTLASEIAAIVGYPDPQCWPPGWCGAPLRVQAWLADPAWTPDIILATCRAVMARKRDGPPNGVEYFERAIARAVARVGAPLPKDEPGAKHENDRGFGFHRRRVSRIEAARGDRADRAADEPAAGV
jgi:hypothetical protein